MAADLIPPVPDDQSLGFIMRNWLFKMRRNVNQFVVDISTLVAQIATAITPSNPLTTSNISTYVNQDTIDGDYLVNINADKINAGAIRGINVNAAAHTTRGSYLTAATTSGDTTVNVKDTTDFATSGTAIVFDTTNDRDQFTYTGKTSTTLTGCSGVLAHTNGATIVPLAESMTIDKLTNEMRFYGDRGDGTVEELASIGINSVGGDSFVSIFGTTNSGNSKAGIFGGSYSLYGVYGISNLSYGVSGQSTSGVGVIGVSSSTGIGVQASSSSGWPLYLNGNATKGHFGMGILPGRPSNKTAGNFAMMYTTGGSTDARTGTPRLMYADGTDWRLVSDDTIWTG